MRELIASLLAIVVMLGDATAAEGQLPPLPNDHLLGYRVAVDKNANPAGTPFPKGVTRTIVDQFGTHGACRIKKDNALYNPADKNGEAIQEPLRHYLSYVIACEQKTVDTRTFFDQIFPSGVAITAIKERSILVPSGKSVALTPDPSPPPAGTNHYLCYKAKGPKMAPVTVDVQDQFSGSIRSFALTKIQAVCNPADKDGDDPSAVTDLDHYVCYRAKPTAKISLPTVRTSNLNFGQNTLAPKKELELCIPAFKDALPPTTTTTTTLGECDGGPFSCGGTCPPGGTCAPVGDFPPYCGCIPDGSQACESVDWPYCGGQCPVGYTCGSTAHVPGGGDCICVPTGMQACGESAYPTCGGACVGGDSCYAFIVGGYTFCGCSVTAPCDTSCSGTTGGACPPGEVCHVGLSPCGCAP